MRRTLTFLLFLLLALAAAHAQTAPAWQAGVTYSVGARVTYGGSTYQCLQAHTALSVWTPDVTPALWSKITGGGATCSAAPATPTGLAASGTTSSSTTLAWTPPPAASGCSITGYRVYRNGTLIGSPSGPTLTVTGLNASTTYSFTVAALTSFGASPQTAPLSVTTAAATCAAPPSVPTGLAASSTSSTGTTLTWNPSTASAPCAVTGYRVHQNGALAATTTGTSLTVSGLTASTSYAFTVAATSSYGASAPSAPLTVTTQAAGSAGCAPAWSATAVYTSGMTASVSGVNYRANWWTSGQNPAANSGPSGSGQPWTQISVCAPCSSAPATPTGLAMSSVTATSASLRWNAVAPPANCSITGYSVYRNGVAAGTTTGTTFTAAGLSPSTVYQFSVAASTAFGTSSASSAISVMTSNNTTSGGTRTFAPYIDMGLTASQDLLTIQQQSGIRTFTLAFIVNSGTCVPSWGGGGTIYNDTLANGTTMTALIQGVRNAGGDVIISFGGANGQELGLVCPDVASLRGAYEAVINRYNPTWVDFDIEGAAVAHTASIARRHQALAQIRAARPGLKISYTLPVLPTGLDGNGYALLTSAKAAGFDPDVVNVMAMDYGAAVDNGGAMGSNAVSAASNTRQQVLSAGLTSTIGVTPMIGVNDVASEIFQLADAQMLLDFAMTNSYVTRLSMWSVSRDNGSCAGSPWATYNCSGLSQSSYQFSSIFSAFQ